MTHHHEIPATAQAAIKQQAVGLLANIRDRIRNRTLRTFGNIYNSLTVYYSDDDAAIDIPLEDRVTLIESCAESVGIYDVPGCVNRLSYAIEMTAAYVVCLLAKDMVRELVAGFGKVCDDFDFDDPDLKPENDFGMFAHTSLEAPAEGCLVYKYRGVDGGKINADVWQYTFPGTDIKLYITQYVES